MGAPSWSESFNRRLSPGAGQPLSAEQREKLVKQKEQYEKAAEKLEDQVKEYLDFKLKTNR